MNSRVCLPPPPQVFVHCDQGLHLPLQSTSHSCVLQDCDCKASGQSRPPWAASTLMLNCLVCIPPPQVCEQSDHSEYSPWQSTAQGIALQGSSTGDFGHARPP